jgi:hypothetical protein
MDARAAPAQRGPWHLIGGRTTASAPWAGALQPAVHPEPQLVSATTLYVHDGVVPPIIERDRTNRGTANAALCTQASPPIGAHNDRTRTSLDPLRTGDLCARTRVASPGFPNATIANSRFSTSPVIARASSSIPHPRLAAGTVLKRRFDEDRLSDVDRRSLILRPISEAIWRAG